MPALDAWKITPGTLTIGGTCKKNYVKEKFGNPKAKPDQNAQSHYGSLGFAVPVKQRENFCQFFN